MNTLIAPSLCLLHDYDDEMETLTDINTVTLKLINSDEELVFNESDNLINTDYIHFDY